MSKLLKLANKFSNKYASSYLDELFDSVINLGSAIRSWNLKYDIFPDINEWLDKHWKAPYGKEVAERYLNNCMQERASNYWGTRQSDGKELNDSYKALLAIIADLNGDLISGAIQIEEPIE